MTKQTKVRISVITPKSQVVAGYIIAKIISHHLSIIETTHLENGVEIEYQGDFIPTIVVIHECGKEIHQYDMGQMEAFITDTRGDKAHYVLNNKGKMEAV